MKRFSIFMVLLALLAFVSVGLAQQTKPAPAPAPVPTPAPAAPEKPAPPAPVKLEKFNGVIAKVDEAAKSVVVTAKKVEKTFLTNEQTKILKGKETISLADLKSGMNVSIEYKKEGDQLIASMIKVAVPKAAPKKEETKK